VILGNDKAMEAALAGQTNPWPDGAILGKLVWKEDRHPKWPAAIIPGDLSHIEFMIKDQARLPLNLAAGTSHHSPSISQN